MPLSDSSPSTIGVVLAGGASRRVGRDKALLRRPDGPTLLEHAIATLHAAGLREVAISVSDARRREALSAALPALTSIPFVVDDIPGCGPLGGLHAALCAYPGRSVLLVASDMPHLDVAALHALLAQAGQADIVMPRAGGYDQPLHALYGPACREVAMRLLDAGDRSMRALAAAPDLRVRVLDAASLGIDGAVFENLNTPHDVAAAGYA